MLLDSTFLISVTQIQAQVYVRYFWDEVGWFVKILPKFEKSFAYSVYKSQ